MINSSATKMDGLDQLKVHESREKVREHVIKEELVKLKHYMERHYYREVIYLVWLDFCQAYLLTLLRIKQHRYTLIHTELLRDNPSPSIDVN